MCAHQESDQRCGAGCIPFPKEEDAAVIGFALYPVPHFGGDFRRMSVEPIAEQLIISIITHIFSAIF
jgi:hypothetical protein